MWCEMVCVFAVARVVIKFLQSFQSVNLARKTLANCFEFAKLAKKISCLHLILYSIVIEVEQHFLHVGAFK